MRRRQGARRVATLLRALRRDQRGSSAVEFSIVALPFILTLLAILQMSIYYMTQSALDAGVMHAGDSLVNTFYGSATPVIPNLNTLVANASGGLISASTVKVDLQPFSNLTTALVPITNNVANTGVAQQVIALRAQAPVVNFLPGIGSYLLVVRSSVLIRRQGQ